MIFAVAPFAGAWIEIEMYSLLRNASRSLPSRERGLKYNFAAALVDAGQVAPFAGAWIEILVGMVEGFRVNRRSLRGSVD